MAEKHRHDPTDCFAEAAETYVRLRMASLTGRAGFYLYVGNNEGEPMPYVHYLGNTAFAAGAFKGLVATIIKGHKSGECEHCDRVANALRSADRAFEVAMFGAEKKC